MIPGYVQLGRTMGWTQNTLEGLDIPSDLRMPQDLPQDNCQKIVGWTDFYLCPVWPSIFQSQPLQEHKLPNYSCVTQDLSWK